MTYFPQLTQFPIQKSRSVRTVVNESADGAQFKARGAMSCDVNWQFTLTALNNAERDEVIRTWTECRGRAIPFVYLDPTANLLCWSEDFTKAVWTKGPSIQANGKSLVNSGQAADRVVQVLSAPAWFQYCMSLRVRGQSPQPLAALCVFEGQERRTPFRVTADWQPFTFLEVWQSSAEEITFGLELPAGASIEVAEMQVEAQVGNSIYKPTTTRNGIYRSARFAMDELVVSEDGDNDASVTIRITAREV